MKPRPRIENSGVTLDIAFELQATHAVEDRRGGKVDLEGEVLDRDAAVFLEGLENLDVGFVEFRSHGGGDYSAVGYLSDAHLYAFSANISYFR